MNSAGHLIFAHIRILHAVTEGERQAVCGEKRPLHAGHGFLWTHEWAEKREGQRPRCQKCDAAMKAPAGKA